MYRMSYRNDAAQKLSFAAVMSKATFLVTPGISAGDGSTMLRE
jgi:hypothetical protein